MTKDLWKQFIHMPCIDPHCGSGLLSVTPMGTLKARSPAGRNRSLAIGFAILLMLAATATLHAMPRAERHETRHEIEHLEDAWRDAVLKGNIAAMDALLADDYMAITPTGILQSKEQALANLRAGTVHFNSIDLSDRKIRLYGTTALVTSRAEVTATGSDGNISGSYRYTRVYVKDAHGAWHIVSFEASRIKDAAQHR
jgi:ketosteroid isomerase-like protein